MNNNEANLHRSTIVAVSLLGSRKACGNSLRPVSPMPLRSRSHTGRFERLTVIAQSSAILQLLSGEDQSLLVRGNAFLVLDLGLDVVDGVTV